MHNNRYTQAADGIKAPESAVEKALETARVYEAEKLSRPAADARPAKRDVSKRKVFRYAAAAVLALAILLGAVIGPGLFGGKAGLAFTVTVHAAELTKDSPVYVEAGKGSMNIVGRGDSGKGSVPGPGGTEYYVSLPFAVEGENVAGVTYSTDKDLIAVICSKDNDPVTAGDKAGEGFDSLFDQYYVNQAEKAAEGSSKEEIRSGLLSRKYSAVTLDAGKDAPSMALVGSSSKDVSEFYEQDYKEASSPSGDLLEKRAARFTEMIGSVIHCDVRFVDGSEQRIDIQLSFAVMQASSADPEAFAGLTAEEKAMKDYTGIFVAYTIVG